ncbi:molybdopterin converting factor, subunit 1 [Cokeromyces recurvatus]|uniref:molybdopterin converting factor, subunit 1 n=1 Tax=Cokeromyces recurvatus TaxID=90255 RepID=UPI002220BCC7|nr:molybdopterin converting factor, subunit 1 [Cokeromyces recurvatus]KAI7902083.1 molybdopterin converting factor, subunit 1 [Cokeromyces recurvatus]
MKNKVTVLYFAALKDITGKETEEIEVLKTISLKELSDILISKYGTKFEELLSISMYAVNMEYIEKDKEVTTHIHQNSEIAIIPPVSGG